MPKKKTQLDSELVALSIRLPASIYEKIQTMATGHRRSLNQETVWLLERALEILDEEPKKKAPQKSD